MSSLHGGAGESDGKGHSATRSDKAVLVAPSSVMLWRHVSLQGEGGLTGVRHEVGKILNKMNFKMPGKKPLEFTYKSKVSTFQKKQGGGQLRYLSLVMEK